MWKAIALIACSALLCAGCASQKDLDTTSANSAPQPVRVSTENTDAAEPAVATSADGSTFVAWVEHRADGQADVFLTKYNASGGQAFAPVRVNPEAGRATAWRGDQPTIAVAADGAVYVNWTARVAAKGHETNLYLSTSRDGGRSFESPVRINDDEKPAQHGMHSMALGKDGRLYFAWLDERNLSPAAPVEKHRGEVHAMESNRELFTAYSADGGRTISRNQLVAREACPCCKTALTVAPDGHVYVGFRQVLKGDYRHIAVASSADGGRTFSAPLIVSDDQWVIAGCPVSGPALLAEDGGALKVLWYTEGDAGERGLYLTQSLDGGRTFSARRLVSKGQIHGTPLLLHLNDGNSLALWQAVENGLMSADISKDGSITSSTSVLKQASLPSAAISSGHAVVAYISTLNNQRSIWFKS
ncbi:MAG: exo-alpha-sialidase [Acidobacteria bacterium]|nr:exo-alpha-sialidase [Acidobacteriota bacterium]